MLTDLNTPILIVSSLTASFLVAVWLSIIIWTARDIKLRSRDPFLRILSVSAVIILNLIGFVVYLILRPKYTISELFQQSLEEEALLQSLETNSRCPACGKPVENNWHYCPHCKFLLKIECLSCHQSLDLDWIICPFCGVNVEITETPKYGPSAKSETLMTTDVSHEVDPNEPPSDELIEDDNFEQL